MLKWTAHRVPRASGNGGDWYFKNLGGSTFRSQREVARFFGLAIPESAAKKRMRAASCSGGLEAWSPALPLGGLPTTIAQPVIAMPGQMPMQMHMALAQPMPAFSAMPPGM